MTSAENNQSSNLYIRDTDDPLVGKYHSSRPTDIDENVGRSHTEPSSTGGGGGPECLRINDGRGGQFRIFKSPMKAIKRDSQPQPNNNNQLLPPRGGGINEITSEEIRVFAKLIKAANKQF